MEQKATMSPRSSSPTLRRRGRTEGPFADTPSVKPDSVGTEVLEGEIQIGEAEPPSRASSHRNCEPFVAPDVWQLSGRPRAVG